jgi:TubC N-terminal docking domain
MTALELVETLRARGVELVPAGDRLRFRPGEAVTAEERAALRLHKPEVLRLLAPESAVTDRAEAFRQQLNEWTASGRFGAPLLGLPGVEVRTGSCVSCGVTLGEEQTWRCRLCVRAVKVVLGLSPLEEPAP